MAISVVMPALEMAQETGKLLAWRKKEGERVSKGEPLLEIETDKAVVEIEAPGDGVLAGVTAGVGAVVPVGETIAWIVGPGEVAPAKTTMVAPSARASSASSGAAGAAAAAPAAPAVAVAATTGAAAQLSPKARRLAKELGVDIARMRGTGPDGIITTEDVQAAGSAGATMVAAAPVATAEALSPVARLMAERTTQSWTSVPHFFVVRDVDAGGILAAQKRFGAEVEKANGAKLSITDLLIALVARVLAKHPRMYASWTGSAVQMNAGINISVAMAVKDGVVAPVIAGADTAALAKISEQRRDLAERARANRLRPADITGGTFTISNLGMYKVDAFTAIITPPQAAILAVGGISERVVAVDGKPGVRPMMTLTLSSDHRVVDGARAAEFLSELADAIREPEKRLG
ncbi:MAG TPA: dihydrolipoamide acetyltransferase family protein [Candidatus Dormibacteraeota bacterium]|nr:dihydrolipoamide acetyltransferase family protein [Candidatus Dormibacteraeota bacterium]